MTIAATPSEISYAGDGVSTVFPINYVFDTSADLKVIQTDSSGNPVVLASGFSVSGGGGSTGTLTLLTALPVDSTLTILDNPDRTQTADYIANDDFSADSHERALDRGVRISKRLYQLLLKCIRVDDGDPSSGSGTVLDSVQARKGKYLFFNVVSGAIEYATALIGNTLSQSTIGQFFYPQTASEALAGVTPVNYAYPFMDGPRYGVSGDGSDQTVALRHGYTVGNVNVALSGGGNALFLPEGAVGLTSQVTILNRVRTVGRAKRGTVLLASAAHSGPYMFRAENGGSSMFDCLYENLDINCNDVAGLGGVLSDAWQEGGGLRDVLLHKFRTYGVKFQTGDGGASLCSITDCEIFGSTSGATAGIYADVSASAAFLLRIEKTSITGGGPLRTTLPRAIHMIGASLTAIDAHFEVCQTAIYLDGAGNHVLINCTGASSTSGIDTLVELASTFTGSLTMIGCARNGATNFLKDNRTGGLGTITGYDIPHLQITTNDFGIRSANTAHSICFFNGTTAGTNAPTKGKNVTSITRNSAGSYRVTETRARASAESVPHASCNLNDAIITVSAVGASTFDILIRVAGVPTDSNEIHVINFGFGM